MLCLDTLGQLGFESAIAGGTILSRGAVLASAIGAHRLRSKDNIIEALNNLEIFPPRGLRSAAGEVEIAGGCQPS